MSKQELSRLIRDHLEAEAARVRKTDSKYEDERRAKKEVAERLHSLISPALKKMGIVLHGVEFYHNVDRNIRQFSLKMALPVSIEKPLMKAEIAMRDTNRTALTCIANATATANALRAELAFGKVEGDLKAKIQKFVTTPIDA